MQTVSYSVDGYGGYVADVSYEGEPAYPEAAPYHPAPAPAPYHPAPYHPAPKPYHPAPAYPRPSYPVQPHAAPSVVKPKVAEAPAAAAAKPAEESREAKAIEAAPVQQAQAVVRTTSLPRIGKKHALKKYDQLALNTSCFWIKYYYSCAISEKKIVTKIMNT